MTTEGQDALVAELERFTRLTEKLAAAIRRLTVDIKRDLDDCRALARGPSDDDDKGSD